MYPATPYRNTACPQMSSLAIDCNDDITKNFMTPLAQKISSRSSPPPLYKERNRERQDSIFEAQDGSVLPQFLIPALDNAPKSPQRKPLKRRMTQRLTHPSAVVFDSSDLKSSRREVGFVPIQLSKTFDECSLHPLRSSVTSEKSDSFKVTKVERPKKFVRRQSSNALSA